MRDPESIDRRPQAWRGAVLRGGHVRLWHPSQTPIECVNSGADRRGCRVVTERVYEKNFLAQVIIAVEFTTPVESLRDALPDGFTEAFADVLPVLEPRDGTTQQVSFSVRQRSAEFTQQSDTFKLWRLLSADGGCALEICRDFVNLSVSRYLVFEEFAAPFFKALSLIADNLHGDVAYRRLGLRYIDEIKPAGRKPLDWTGLITSRLTGAFRFAEGDPLVRAMGMVEVDLGSCRLRMQYGMPNPDHPAPIGQKLFVLDTDVYVNELIAPDDVERQAAELCKVANDYFERAIGDRLRRLMKPRAEA